MTDEKKTERRQINNNINKGEDITTNAKDIKCEYRNTINKTTSNYWTQLKI